MTASFVLREAFRQVPDDSVAGTQLLLHVRQLATRLLQEEAATGHIETGEQVDKEDDCAADNDTQMAAEDEPFVRCQELQLAHEHEGDEHQRHRRQEGAVRDHWKAWSMRT